MTDRCTALLVDTQPLPNGSDCSYYEIEQPATQATDITLYVQLTPDQYIIEWYVDYAIPEFLDLTAEHRPDNPRAGAIAAVDTPDGTVIEQPLTEIQQGSWFPDLCSFLEVDTQYHSQVVAWDYSPPHNSVVLTSYTDDYTLLDHLLSHSITPDESVAAFTDTIRNLYENHETA